MDISNCSYLVNAYQSGEHFSDEDYEIYHYYTGVDEEDDARTYTLLCDPSITIIVDNSGGDTPVVIPTPAPVPQPAQPTVPSTVQESITISEKPTIKKPSSTKNKITVSWKHFKQTKKTSKIWKKIKKVQIQCATDKAFTNIIKTSMIGKKKTKATIKGLSKKTTYYVRVRYYDGTGYSKWSSVKKVKTKK